MTLENQNNAILDSQELNQNELHNIVEQKKQNDTIKEQQLQRLIREQKKEQELEKLEEKKKKLLQQKSKKYPLLRYYNSELLIPCTRTQIIPGNCYVFQYKNYDHVPTPLVFYIGSNNESMTMEGISLQYLSIGERKRLFEYLKKTPLHSEQMIAGSMKIKSLQKDHKHIFRKTYTSQSLYQFLRNNLTEDIVFYRRYKWQYIQGRIYVVPIEALERALEINTPIKPMNNNKLYQSKEKFSKIINKIK